MDPFGGAVRRLGVLRAAGPATEVVWRKASASETSGCVEVAVAGRAVYVQDSKQADGGVVLGLSARAWRGLAGSVVRDFSR
ncbi:uncharacterized protein DUF397 [Actinocorallia herbida]|uniref:Uncharacterized protein DUF397 n=1 Tax=Actinocorallia herbida TaxID=58109 RepID=A0A3N1CNV6_9ACTN|nr:uncharacterized protein DUF397 [Actinocorallia herbida]